MKKAHVSTSMIGGSTLLVIFSILCLAVFTMLSLITVQSEKRLADASVNAVSNYYQAELEAETIFSQLRQNKIPEGVIQQGNIFHYDCSISENQELSVILEHKNNRWTVLQWQVVAHGEITNIDVPSLWDGF